MKITNTQYATALYESVKGKSQKEIDVAVANFVRVLSKNNQIKDVNNIIGKFSEIWNKKEGIIEAEVTSREKLDKKEIDELISFIGKKYVSKNVEILNKIDPAIKGGIIIRIGDEVMDASVSGQLKRLKSSLEK